MVKGTIETRDGVHRIECRGHATGSEKVCAAISALMYALVGYLVNRDNAVIHDKILDSGYNRVVFEGFDDAFEVVRTGLALIAHTYPEYLKITEKEG